MPCGPRTLLGCQSAKPKHLKGKKTKFPWVAFQMLRSSGLAAQHCPKPTWHASHCYACCCSLYYFLYYGVLFNFEGGRGANILKYESPPGLRPKMDFFLSLPLLFLIFLPNYLCFVIYYFKSCFTVHFCHLE